MIKIADKYSNCKDLVSDPPIGWSSDDILGYAVWSFTLCENVKDDANMKLRQKVREMFKSTFGLYPGREDLGLLLNKYYNKL